MVTKKEDPYFSNTKGANKKGLAPKPLQAAESAEVVSTPRSHSPAWWRGRVQLWT
ncbi:MAG: hypothetical protein JWR78_4099 [Mycobacterium sp.]|nr:hypothetical protein [Mycobacterium sp.]